MSGSRHFQEIQRLDPARDHQRVVHLSGCYEFPWDSVRAMDWSPVLRKVGPFHLHLLRSDGQ